MEKLQYYLIGKEFVLQTDHKAMEELKKKKEFGSSRIIRWFERLEKFQFKVEYNPGRQMIQSDALSRATTSCNNITKDDMETRILKVHETKNHRKNLREELKKENINIKKYNLNKILNKCIVCKQSDKKSQRSGYYIKTSFPGERVAADMLEISKKERILVVIDYFTRKIYARLFSSKEGFKVLNFLKEIYKELQFKVLQTDNGKEFMTKDLDKWLKENKIEHKFSVPYYHPSNGRVERVNRTIRVALKKTKGMNKMKLKNVIENYNNIQHRALGISPNEAMDPKNKELVIKNSEKYIKEFRKYLSKQEKFVVGEKILMKNDLKSKKMDLEYCDEGTVVENLGKDRYKIRLKNNKEVIRHASQLKSLGRGKLDTDSILC